MENSILIGNYLKKINEEKFSSKETVTFNHKTMYRGDFCLYKVMYLSNIFYHLINGDFLMPSSDFQAWVNGPVNVAYRNGNTLLNKKLSDDSKNFLDRVNKYFANFEPEELYEITHWDPAFKSTKNDEVFQTQNYMDVYKVELKDALESFIDNY